MYVYDIHIGNKMGPWVIHFLLRRCLMPHAIVRVNIRNSILLGLGFLAPTWVTLHYVLRLPAICIGDIPHLIYPNREINTLSPDHEWLIFRTWTTIWKAFSEMINIKYHGNLFLNAYLIKKKSIIGDELAIEKQNYDDVIWMSSSLTSSAT